MEGFMENIGGFVALAYMVVFTIIDYKIMVSVKTWKKATVVFWTTLIFFLIIPPIIASGLYVSKFKKVLKANCEMVSNSTDNVSVDRFLTYVKQWGFCNEPQQWNQLRGTWFIVNESSNVSTAKKKELRDYLITNGLRLNNSEKQIIDNYKG